jgi:hypothetical protein
MDRSWLKRAVVPLAVALAGAASGTTLLAQSPSSSSPSSAPSDPSIAQRKENQQDRIAQGIKSGQLTAGETAKLENQQRGINKQVSADRKANGGPLTAGEKKQINHEQNNASKNIYQKKHDAARQGGTKK